MIKKIFGQVGRLKNDKIEEYIELHADVWPKVLEMIRECNLQNYSIFIKEDVVFAYFEYMGPDYETDIKRMADDSITQQWWALTKPCFTVYNELSDVNFYEDMKSIFHMA